MLRTLLTRRAGQPGTKKLMGEDGEELVCVRYRYDDERHERIKTVEIVVERVRWQRKRIADQPALVRFRVEGGEDLLRRAVLFAGGRWDEGSDTWTLDRGKARALGLMSRLTSRARRGAKR